MEGRVGNGELSVYTIMNRSLWTDSFAILRFTTEVTPATRTLTTTSASRSSILHPKHNSVAFTPFLRVAGQLFVFVPVLTECMDSCKPIPYAESRIQVTG